MQPDTPILVMLSIVLVLVIYNDLRRMRIPNTLSVILLAIFPFFALDFESWNSVFLQIGFSALIFVLGFVAFALRAMGGGDVKVLAALALFVPLGHLPLVMVTFSVCLFLGVAFVLCSRKLVNNPERKWAFLSTKRFPLGLPIGLCGLVIVQSSFAALG